MKQRILEILDELTQINNNMLNIFKNRIINNQSVLNINDDIDIKKNNIKLETLQKEMELLVIEYEKGIFKDTLDNQIEEFKEIIQKIVEEISEENKNVS